MFPCSVNLSVDFTIGFPTACEGTRDLREDKTEQSVDVQQRARGRHLFTRLWVIPVFCKSYVCDFSRGEEVQIFCYIFQVSVLYLSIYFSSLHLNTNIWTFSLLYLQNKACYISLMHLRGFMDYFYFTSLHATFPTLRHWLQPISACNARQTQRDGKRLKT